MAGHRLNVFDKLLNIRLSTEITQEKYKPSRLIHRIYIKDIFNCAYCFHC